jgi:hypothetical protein
MNRFRCGVFLALLMGLSIPATGHHSASMFDAQKVVVLEGKVREFRFTNPHCWIQLLVTANGKTTEWSIEMGSPQGLYRSGWRPGTLKAGDEIKVTVHPERNGSPVAQFKTVTRADGKPVLGVKP